MVYEYESCAYFNINNKLLTNIPRTNTYKYTAQDNTYDLISFLEINEIDGKNKYGELNNALILPIDLIDIIHEYSTEPIGILEIRFESINLYAHMAYPTNLCISHNNIMCDHPIRNKIKGHIAVQIGNSWIFY